MIQLSEKTKRKKAINRAFRKLRAKQAKISGRKPVRDAKYRAFVRSFACVACTGIVEPMPPGCIGICGPIEAAHSGPHAMGQKASDYTCIPLGRGHHQHLKDSYHKVGPKFFKRHNLDREAIISALRARYELLKKGAA